MIEKLDTKMECVELAIFGDKKAECLDFEAARKLNLKINELVDAVNEIMTWRFDCDDEPTISKMETVETRAENVQPDIETRPENVQIPNIKTYTCSDGFVTDNEQVAKSHEINIKNKKLLCPFCQHELVIPKEENRNGIQCCVYRNPKCEFDGWHFPVKLVQELITTRKALDKSEHCCTEWEKQALDYKAENIALSGELERTRNALDKGMEHITGLNNMIESWLNLINSDLDQETKLHILKSAISAYVENKGGNNEK